MAATLFERELPQTNESRAEDEQIAHFRANYHRSYRGLKQLHESQQVSPSIVFFDWNRFPCNGVVVITIV